MQSRLIRNRDKAKQLLAFDGLSWGTSRCTDLDVSLDWGQQTFCFIEIKTEGVPLTVGQRIHLTGLVDGLRKGGKEAYAIVACHVTPTTEDVHVAQCRTDSIYSGNNWERVDTGEELCVTLDRLYDEHKKRQRI